LSVKTDKKNSLALSAENSDESPLVGLFANFADYMEKFIDDPDGLDRLAYQLENNPEELFANFADDLDKFLEKDIQKAVKLAKKEVADARLP